MAIDLRVIVIVGTLLAVGPACASRSRSGCLPKELTRESGLIQVSAGDAENRPTEADLLKAFAQRTRQSGFNAPSSGRQPQILVLSGGGMYGAYSVGVLSGWSAAGTRPEFDVVTGVSTGALASTYAFLGKAYDQQMVEAYTSIRDRHIYRKRITGSALLTDAIASSAPLARLIDDQVSDEVVAAVAAAHRAGRRLYVGTTNIDTRRLVVWDMGAIAASGRPEAKQLYRKVLLASASPPGFLPPVAIEVEVNGKSFTELHVDGGATTGLFLHSTNLNVEPGRLNATEQPLQGADVYVIVAGKLYADPSCTQRRAVRIAENALHSLVYSQTRSELFRIYTLCQVTGMRFHLTSIPENASVGGEGMKFDPGEMRRLCELGHAAATSGLAWRTTPPDGEPCEQIRPRTGNHFIAPGAPGPG